MEQVISGCNMKCDNGDCALYYAELNNDNNELIYGFNCSDNPDCYYKQLKRLERQYEDVLKLAKENADSNEYCLKELEKENEFLKKELEKHKSKIGHLLSPLTDSDFQIYPFPNCKYYFIIVFSIAMFLGNKQKTSIKR